MYVGPSTRYPQRASLASTYVVSHPNSVFVMQLWFWMKVLMKLGYLIESVLQVPDQDCYFFLKLFFGIFPPIFLY